MSKVSRAETVTSPGVPKHRPASFDEFYVGELPRLVALARGLCGASIAEDVAQEAMLVAYRRWREVARPRAAGSLGQRRTCANLAVSAVPAGRVVELRATGTPRPPDVTPPTELSPAGRGVLGGRRGHSPRRQAQAAALRFVYDLPIADIAAALGCTEGTVKQHLSRARHALADSLGVTEEESSSLRPAGHGRHPRAARAAPA